MRQALLSFVVVVAALCVQQAVSHPFDKRAMDDIDEHLADNDKRTIDYADIDVLNYALTLEHLENAFYSGALDRFDEEAFQAAGLPCEARVRFSEVAAHEATHVAALRAALALLGGEATQPCTYSFPYYDVHSFTALSQVFEGVGTSAYTGAAQDIKLGVVVTAAASILATEARHASWVASAVNKNPPWSGPFETPLLRPVVLALVAPFIKSCPPTNPPLIGLVLGDLLPILTLLNAVPGQNAVVDLDPTSKSPKYVVFYSGPKEMFVAIDSKGEVAVPANMTGLVYAVGTTSGTEVSHKTICTRPTTFIV